MKRTSILAMFLSAVTLLSTSCGTSDKVASVSISAAGTTGIVNLAGLGGTIQLQVSANYTSGKIVDETNWATYQVSAQGTLNDGVTPLPTPPQGVSVNATGMVTATEPGICTWTNLAAGTTSTTPSWAFTGWYQIVADYKGMLSQPIYIPVASAADTLTGQVGQCGPS